MEEVHRREVHRREGIGREQGTGNRE